jgi:hypothetical protein
MSITIKKPTHRSPNYPLKPLDWAVQTALGLLNKEGKHAVPVDIIAQNLGYKDATNGKVRRILANLKAFGVLDKAAGGKLAVSPDVARYKIMPTEDGKKAILEQWLRKPTIFAKLLDKYDHDLPSDNVLLFELVDEYGFSEQAAANLISVFKASLSFVLMNESENDTEIENDEILESDETQNGDEEEFIQTPKVISPSSKITESFSGSASLVSDSTVRYPVRLAGGRMAWIITPEPFFEADKKKLLAQIGVIGTEDEDYDFGDTDM